MAFKTATQYNEERYGGFFLLKNDGDYKDVVLLYQNIEDVLVASTHYIKSENYSGYVHCIGKGCPACQKGIRVQNKLFIPLYDIEADEVVFWDRSARFENSILPIFDSYPNPSEFIFRITRNGAAGDVNTSYDITARYKNTLKSYATILAEKNIKLPDYYETVCREVLDADLRSMLQNDSPNGVSAENLEAYNAQPRAAAPTNYAPEPVPEAPISIPDAPEDDGDGPEF